MTAIALAKTVEPVPPDMICVQVYNRMAKDETLFALPIVAADGVPVGLAGRIALMSQFARPYWREVYSQRPIAKLMDAAPVIVDIATPAEAIGLRFAEANRPALNAGFIFTQGGRYHGIGSTIELLQLIADHAHQRAQELTFAQDEIRSLNDTLERRVLDRTEQLHAAQHEIVRKERLAAIGQLTATVAHEIRNPLSSIRNSLYTVKEALGETAPVLNRPIGRIERSIERCDGIINELLDYTRVRELKRRSVAIDAWLGEVISELTLGDMSLVRNFDAHGYRVAIDIDRMRRVVVNVIENAAQAMTEVEGERKITVATRVALGALELTVTDNGPGIPADVLPKVFEPLFSTKSFGTGLGLPLVKQIVEQHGGSVALASAAPHGARVIIRLKDVGRDEIAA